MRVEAGLHGLHRDQSFDQHAGGRARRMNEAAICVTAKMRSRRPVLPVMRTAAAGEAEAVARFGRRQAGNEREQNRGDDGEQRAYPEHAGVDTEIERAHRETGSVVREDSNHRTRGRGMPSNAPASTHQQAFGEKRAAESAGRGAEGCANRELTFAANAARQNQIGDVRTRDHEDQQRRSQQNEQNGFCAGSDLLFQRNG